MKDRNEAWRDKQRQQAKEAKEKAAKERKDRLAAKANSEVVQDKFTVMYRPGVTYLPLSPLGQIQFYTYGSMQTDEQRQQQMVADMEALLADADKVMEHWIR
jgi:hypothetical protein